MKSNNFLRVYCIKTGSSVLRGVCSVVLQLAFKINACNIDSFLIFVTWYLIAFYIDKKPYKANTDFQNQKPANKWFSLELHLFQIISFKCSTSCLSTERGSLIKCILNCDTVKAASKTLWPRMDVFYKNPFKTFLKSKDAWSGYIFKLFSFPEFKRVGTSMVFYILS